MFFRRNRQKISRPEKMLVEHTARGELCDLSELGDSERTIRASVLRDLWLQKHGWSVDPKGVHLKGAIIIGELHLVDSRLPFGMEFVDCNFRDGINLSGAELRYLKMPGCNVKYLEAKNIEIKEDVHLRAGFVARGEVNLSGSRIKGELRIENCTIMEALNLKSASIEGSFVFHQVDILSIDLTDARTGEWDDQWGVGEMDRISLFEQRLWEWGFHKWLLRKWERKEQMRRLCDRLRKYRLRGFVYNSIGERLSKVAHENPYVLGLWLALADGETYDPQPYEQMARVLKIHGHEQAYRELAIAKRIERRRRGNLPAYLAFFDFLLLDVPVRYGYKPWRAIGLGLIICLIASQLFFRNAQAMAPSDGDILVFIGTKKGSQATHEAKSLKELIPEGYPHFCPLVYTIDLFVPIIDLHQERYWVPNTTYKIGRLLWIVKWIVILSGWYLSTLFVSSFTGLLKVE